MKLKSVLISAIALLSFGQLGFAALSAEARPIFVDAGTSAAGGLVNDDAVDQTGSPAQTNDEAASTDNYSAFGAQQDQQDNNANDSNMMDDDDSGDDNSSDSDDNSGNE